MREIIGESPREKSSTKELGRRIGALRRSRGTTIAALSAAAEVSSGLLSQIERGNGNPSYITLLKLSRALDVPISDFFTRTDGARERVVRKHSRRVFLNFDADITFEVLTPDLHGKLAMVTGLVAPGWTNRDSPYQHEGDGEECLLVLRGRLDVHVSGVRYTLEDGDAITFPSSEEHWYENTGDLEVHLVQAIAPPNF
ncbi:helix-turn-helix domain-containing protein [Microbacterium sp. NPDC055357]